MSVVSRHRMVELAQFNFPSGTVDGHVVDVDRELDGSSFELIMNVLERILRLQHIAVDDRAFLLHIWGVDLVVHDHVACVVLLWVGEFGLNEEVQALEV